MEALRKWRRVGSRTLHQQDRAVVREDQLELPDGRLRTYPVMFLGASAGVLPFLTEDRVILVRQYRHVTQDFSWEVPGGGMEPGESPADTAQRELREEAGYRAAHLIRLGKFWPNNAYLDEVIHLYLGTDLVADSLPADQDERLEVGVFSFGDALAMAQDDRIMCGLTKLAILWAALPSHREARSIGPTAASDRAAAL